VDFQKRKPTFKDRHPIIPPPTTTVDDVNNFFAASATLQASPKE